MFEELNHAIQDIKNTTPGEDDIPAHVYKALTNENKQKLLQLFNDSCLSGSAQTKESLNSYRPIALKSMG